MDFRWLGYCFLIYYAESFYVDINNDRICFSEMQEISGFPQKGSYSLLKKMFDYNCTHISGNLILFGLYPNADGYDPDLRFLDSIQEISGFLIIMNSSVSQISFKNLKIIRGFGVRYKLHYDRNPASIVIRNNGQSMKQLIFDNLQVIQSGDVYIYDNIANCDLTPDVSWNQILANPLKQNVYTSAPSNPLQPSRNCPQNSVSNGRCLQISCDWCFQKDDDSEGCCNDECVGGCSGPSPENCFACKNFKDGKTCVKSCLKPVSIQNYMLSLNIDFKYRFEQHCVTECPNGFLSQKSDCVRECSSHDFYPSGKHCLPCDKSCPKVCAVSSDEDSINGIDMNQLTQLANCTTIKGNLIITDQSFSSKGGRIAIKSADDLWVLHSVKEVTGFVYINLRHVPMPLFNLTFLENLRKIGGSMFQFSMVVLNGNITFPGLYSLRDVPRGEVIFIDSPNLCYVQASPFKENDKRFAGVKNDEGLSSLKIKAIRLPTFSECQEQGALCHPSCDPTHGCWGPRREDCLRCLHRSIDNTVCVDSCDELLGFYPINEQPSALGILRKASGNDNPLSHRLLLAKLAAGMKDQGESTWREIDEVPKGLEGSCGRCHVECATGCHGPEADQCEGGCRHAIEGNTCVQNCSYTSYLDEARNICLSCQGHCHRRSITKEPICSGPGHHPGPGGCNKCEKFLEIIPYDGRAKGEPPQSQNVAMLCMRGPCPSGTFSTFEAVDPTSTLYQFTEVYSRTIPVCRACHPYCSECTSYTVLRESESMGCVVCRGFWFKDMCMLQCPQDSTFQVSLTLSQIPQAFHFKQSLNHRGLFLSSKVEEPLSTLSIWSRQLAGHCLVCQSECRHGCWGPSNEHCFQCANVRVWRIQAEESNEHRRLWHTPSGEVYHLNENASQQLLQSDDFKHQINKNPSKAFAAVFTCLPKCPNSLPFAIVDPLTGDLTCQISSSSSANEHPTALSGDMNQPKKRFYLGVGIIIATVCLIGLSLISCCVLRLIHKARVKNKPIFHFIQLIEKASDFFKRRKKSQRVPGLRIYDQTTPNCYSNRLNLALQPPFGETSTDLCSCGFLAEANSNNGCMACQYAYQNRPTSMQTDVVLRSSCHYNPVFRRSTRQPNMGRLIMINSDDLIFSDNRQPLGTGAFGAVYKGIWRMPNGVHTETVSSSSSSFTSLDNCNVFRRRFVNVAIKILNETSGSSDLQALLEEAKVMVSVSHVNCLRLLGVCVSGSRRCLVSEYISNGSLDCYLRRYTTELSNSLLLCWATQIAAGMAYLQDTGIIHRDLATRNVLVKRRDLVQITDFGLAKMLSGDEEGGEVIVQSGCVPVRWLAIETLTSGRYSFKTDVWAYGVTLWEIFTFGQRPYAAIATSDIKRFVLTGGRLPQPDICTLKAYQTLLLACWFEHPDERTQFTDFVEILQSKADTPDFFLHFRPTSSLISSTNINDNSRSHINQFSSMQLSTFPSNQFGNSTSCPPQTPCQPLLSPLSLTQFSAFRQPTNQKATSNQSVLADRANIIHSNQRHVKVPNENCSFRSLDQPTESNDKIGDLIRTKTMSTSLDSSKIDETETNLRCQPQEELGNQNEMEEISEQPVLDWPRPEENTIAAGGYVWPHWPVEFNQHEADMRPLSTELPQLNRLIQEREAYRGRLRHQEQLTGDSLNPHLSVGGVQLPDSQIPMSGEYVEPIPRYYLSPND